MHGGLRTYVSEPHGNSILSAEITRHRHGGRGTSGRDTPEVSFTKSTRLPGELGVPGWAGTAALGPGRPPRTRGSHQTRLDSQRTKITEEMRCMKGSLEERTFAEFQGYHGEEWTHADGVTNTSPEHTIRSRRDMPSSDLLRCTKMNRPSWRSIMQTTSGRPRGKGPRPPKAGCLQVYACGSWSRVGPTHWPVPPEPTAHPSRPAQSPRGGRGVLTCPAPPSPEDPQHRLTSMLTSVSQELGDPPLGMGTPLSPPRCPGPDKGPP